MNAFHAKDAKGVLRKGFAKDFPMAAFAMHLLCDLCVKSPSSTNAPKRPSNVSRGSVVGLDIYIPIKISRDPVASTDFDDHYRSSNKTARRCAAPGWSRDHRFTFFQEEDRDLPRIVWQSCCERKCNVRLVGDLVYRQSIPVAMRTLCSFFSDHARQLSHVVYTCRTSIACRSLGDLRRCCYLLSLW